MEKQRMQEDLFNRQLWEGSVYPTSLAWSKSCGLLAYITKSSVQVQGFQYKYMAASTAQWAYIEKVPTSQSIIDTYKPAVGLTSLEGWLHANATKEGPEFKSVEWCRHIHSQLDQSPLLAVLMTDGTFLLLSVSASTETPAVSSEDSACKEFVPLGAKFRLRLHGLSLALNCTDAFNQHSGGGGRIRCFAEHSLPALGATFLVLASSQVVSLWQMQGGGGSGTASQASGSIAIQLSLSHICECTLSGMGTHDFISGLAVCPSDKSGVSAGRVLCGTSAGEVVAVEFAVSPGAAQTGALQAQARVLGRAPVCDVPVSRLELLTADDSGAVSVCVRAGAVVHALPLTALSTTSVASSSRTQRPTGAQLQHKSTAGAVAQFPAVHRGHEYAARLVTGSCAGELGVWVAAAASGHLRGLPSSSTAVTQEWMRLPDVTPNRSAGYPVVGVTSDSLGLMCAYLYKLPALHGNTREVQLNNALRFPRCAVAWELSPFVFEDFVTCSSKTAELLLHAVRACTDAAAGAVRCLSSLPLVFLQALEGDAARQHYRGKIKDLKVYPVVPYSHPRKRNTASGAGGGAGEDSNTSDSEASDAGEAAAATSDSETETPKKGASGKASKGEINKGNRFSVPTGKRKKNSNMSAVYERIEQLERPSKAEAVALCVPTLFDAAVIAALWLAGRGRDAAALAGEESAAGNGLRQSITGIAAQVSGTAAEPGEDGASAGDTGMDLDEKIAALFSMPDAADVEQLSRKVALWQSLHVLLLAMHRVRGVQAIDAEWEHIPASLRRVLHIAYCVQALQRFVQSATQVGVAREQLRAEAQSVLYMCAVLRDYAQDAADPAAAAHITALSRDAEQRVLSGAAHLTTQQLNSELCPLCDESIAFEPTCEDSGDAHDVSRRTVAGGSVLSGACSSCAMRVERCCFSYRLITSAGLGAGHSLLQCPTCDAVTTAQLARSVSAPASCLRAEGPAPLLCPYCAVLMQAK